MDPRRPRLLKLPFFSNITHSVKPIFFVFFRREAEAAAMAAAVEKQKVEALCLNSPSQSNKFLWVNCEEIDVSSVGHLVGNIVYTHALRDCNGSIPVRKTFNHGFTGGFSF